MGAYRTGTALRVRQMATRAKVAQGCPSLRPLLRALAPPP